MPYLVLTLALFAQAPDSLPQDRVAPPPELVPPPPRFEYQARPTFLPPPPVPVPPLQPWRTLEPFTGPPSPTPNTPGVPVPGGW